MKKKKRIVLALAAALMMVLLLAACSDKTIRLGVAGTGGVYQVFGEDYAALQARNGGRKLEVRETAGSRQACGCCPAGTCRWRWYRRIWPRMLTTKPALLRNLR